MVWLVDIVLPIWLQPSSSSSLLALPLGSTGLVQWLAVSILGAGRTSQRTSTCLQEHLGMSNSIGVWCLQMELIANGYRT